MTGEGTGRVGTARARVRRRPAGQLEVFVDPSMTDVWHRRVIAAVVDLALVVGVFTSLTVLQVERLTRDASGMFTPADMDHYNALRAMPNRHVVLGDTTYVLAGAELIMTVVLTLATLLTVYVLMPGYTGRSPGKALTDLRVLTVHGDVVGISHTILRSVVGLVDLLPIIVPWALGARVAGRSPLSQRLGDRAAGTVVVDGRRPLAVVAATATTASPVLASPLADPHAGADERSVTAPADDDHAAVAETERAHPAAGGPKRATLPQPQHRGVTSGRGTDAGTPAGGLGVHAHDRNGGDPHAAAPDDADWLGDLASVLASGHQDGSGPTGAGSEPARQRPGPRPARATDGSRHFGDGEAPVWNDDWQAWLYYDTEQGAWHRHDPESGAWMPIG